VLQPVNRYILVDPNPKVAELNDMGIILPADYKPPEERYSLLRVLGWATDVRFDLSMGCSVVADASMIEEISVNNKTYSVVQDNYIIGVIAEK